MFLLHLHSSLSWEREHKLPRSLSSELAVHRISFNAIADGGLCRLPRPSVHVTQHGLSNSFWICFAAAA